MLASLPPWTLSIVPLSTAVVPSGACLSVARSAALKVAPPTATSLSVVPGGMASATSKKSSANGPPLVTVSVQRKVLPGCAVGGAVLPSVTEGATTLADAVDVGAGAQPPLQVAVAVLTTVAAVAGAR